MSRRVIFKRPSIHLLPKRQKESVEKFILVAAERCVLMKFSVPLRSLKRKPHKSSLCVCVCEAASRRQKMTKYKFTVVVVVVVVDITDHGAAAAV